MREASSSVTGASRAPSRAAGAVTVVSAIVPPALGERQQDGKEEDQHHQPDDEEIGGRDLNDAPMDVVGVPTEVDQCAKHGRRHVPPFSGPEARSQLWVSICPLPA